MIRPIIAAFVLVVTLGVNSIWAQQTGAFKSFAEFKQLVPGIDFFASNRQIIAPYEKPAAQAIARLKTLLGENLPKGAIFICSTLAQKDSIYEPMILKMGYGWILIATTSDVRRQEMMERMKSQMGGSIPAEIIERFKNRMPEMLAEVDKQTTSTTVQQIAYAVLQSMLAKDLQYRSSRLDDMGKSPLPDWLDIGIASYASGSIFNLSYLQQHMDQTFPIEDILSMARPFVASSTDQGGGGGGRGGMSRSGGSNSGDAGDGQGFPQGGFGGMGQGSSQGGFGGMGQGSSQGGFGGMGQGSTARGGNSGRMQGGTNGGGGQRGGSQRSLPKDEQDRMLFDSQSSTFFSFLLEKVGIEKIKELVKAVQGDTEGRDFISRPEVLGDDFEKIEGEWAGWVKAQKSQENTGSGFSRFN